MPSVRYIVQSLESELATIHSLQNSDGYGTDSESNNHHKGNPVRVTFAVDGEVWLAVADNDRQFAGKRLVSITCKMPRRPIRINAQPLAQSSRG